MEKWYFIFYVIFFVKIFGEVYKKIELVVRKKLKKLKLWLKYKGFIESKFMSV